MEKKKILIVDDEKDLTTLLKLNLENTGKYEVFTENNPTQVVARAKKINPEIILLDIVMPGMDGLTVLRELKTKPETLGISVIMLSALTAEATKIEAATLYDESYIEKTADIFQLGLELDKVLERRKRAGLSK